MHLLKNIPLLGFCLISSLTNLATAVPTLDSRAPAIPAAPADPPITLGDGQGQWGANDPGWTDRAKMLEFRAMAKAADALGLDKAATNLDHYLDNKGTDFVNKPEDIMDDIASFKESVRSTATAYAAPAFKAASTGSGSTQTFVSPWVNFYATKELSTDWFFALGGFSYAVAGSVTTAKSGGQWTGELSYKVYIFDRYNWDSGKGVTIGPFSFTDEELGHMHVVGLAREYIVRGASEVFAVSGWDGTTVPLPPNSGGRS